MRRAVTAFVVAAVGVLATVALGSSTSHPAGVVVSKIGLGTVTSSPAGISCGPACRVNNAGIEKPFSLVDMPLEWWQRVIDVNLTGAFLCAREAARVMLADGARGAIVNVTSVHEVIPWERFSHYCASKGGEKLFTQSIARELAPHGIRVVSVAPGAIATPINEEVLADPKRKAAVEAEIPSGRWGEVPDVARAVAWVASEQADYVVGSTIFVDGGMTLYPRFE